MPNCKETWTTLRVLPHSLICYRLLLYAIDLALQRETYCSNAKYHKYKKMLIFPEFPEFLLCIVCDSSFFHIFVAIKIVSGKSTTYFQHTSILYTKKTKLKPYY